MGVQAFSASLLRVLGNAARMFTLMVEVDDFFLKVNILFSFFLNFAVFTQFFIFPSTNQKNSIKTAEKTNLKVIGKKVKRD